MPKESFLRLISRRLLEQYGNDLSRVTMVFPGRRASLFMSQHLAELAQGPVWAPRYISIDDLFAALSPYRKADQLETICELYNIYCKHVGDAESLDEWWSWGEVLLNDFIDIDKHEADAHAIFRNVHDLREVDTDYLTPEEEEIINHFFSNFSREGNSVLKERFLRMWNIMYDIYTDLRHNLTERGLLYNGALERDVIERLGRVGWSAHVESQTALTHSELLSGDQTYVFAGFNILNPVEEHLFEVLQREGRALFFWDYDVMWTSDPNYEAGTFMKANLERFPMDLPRECFDNLRHIRDITFVATSTANAQARYIAPWIDQHLTPRESDTAIVLCNEAIMQPVLYSLPDQTATTRTPRSVNVTMGFPLQHTPVYSFVIALLEMQTDGWNRSLGTFYRVPRGRVEHHPFAQLIDTGLYDVHVEGGEALMDYLSSILKALCQVYAQRDTPTIYEQLYVEALFRIHREVVRIHDLVTSGVLDVRDTTLRRLFRQIMDSISIPFHGEPAQGLQVMGVLETRNLDFSHLLMLSVEEGNLPKRDDTTSFIPYSLREAFHLTTIRHKVSVFAYYFYRLIQRADSVTMVYNTNSTQGQNEMSRFMRQLMAETSLPIRHIQLEASQATSELHDLSVGKSERVLDILHSIYMNEDGGNHALSPTAINSYLKCPMQFYFNYVAGLRNQRDDEDDIEAALVGTVFHDCAEFIYRRLIRGRASANITASLLDEYTKKESRQLSRGRDSANITASLLDEYTKKESRQLNAVVDLMLLVHYFRPIRDDEERARYLQSFVSLDDTLLPGAVHDAYEGRYDTFFTGVILLVKEAIVQYLCMLFRYDRTQAPFTITSLEEAYYLDLTVQTSRGKRTVRTGGRIDRLHQKGDRYVVVDYKTGYTENAVNNVGKLEYLFRLKSQHGYYLQAFLYSLAVAKAKDAAVQPALFYVRNANKPEEYSPEIRIDKQCIEDVRTIHDDYFAHLTQVIEEIFSPNVPFIQCRDANGACKHCCFAKLCGVTVSDN